MATQQTINRLRGEKRGRTTGDQRRTSCKICRFSVLVGDATVWLANPLGMSHLACAQRAGYAQ